MSLLLGTSHTLVKKKKKRAKKGIFSFHVELGSRPEFNGNRHMHTYARILPVTALSFGQTGRYT